MRSSSELDEMSREDICHIDKSELFDITDTEINANLPPEQRMPHYLEQIKNPYCFLCGSTPVQITFKENGEQLGDLLQRYLLHLREA